MTLPVETLKSVPRGKAVWNANGGFVSVLLTHLLQLNLHTLKYRRLCGDMIEVYKITHDMYDRNVALELPRTVMYLVLEVININCKTTAFITTFKNFLLLHE